MEFERQRYCASAAWRCSGARDVPKRVLKLQPLTYREACDFITTHHRHHRPPQGHKFSLAANDGDKVRGIITVGRPVSRRLDNGSTLEVTRCCTDGTKNACSFLYAAAWRATRALGYTRLITYTLATETGASLRAAGWRVLYETEGGSWNVPSRPRVDKHPMGQKLLWEAA
jgi:hypothetical protein